MGMLARYVGNLSPTDERGWTPGHVVDMTAGAGVVGQEGILRLSAVWRAINVVAAAVAVLPIDVVDTLDPDGDGIHTKRIAKGDPMRWKLRRRPNRAQTSYRWRHHAIGHLLLCGNYYAHKMRAFRGAPVEQVWPLVPSRMRIGDILPDGSLEYVYTKKDGTEKPLQQDDVLHLRGFSIDGFTGLNVFEQMRETAQQATVSKRQRSAFLKNEMRPSAVIKYPHELDPLTEANILVGHKKAFGSPEKHGEILVLGDGAEIVPYQVSSKDAQWIESEHFLVEEFLRFIGVPGVLVGHADKTSTYASAEAFFQSFITHCLLPITTNIEQELTDSFYGEAQPDRAVVFNLNSLMRADATARANFYRVMVELGIFTRNEVRSLENYNPLEGLDEPLTPKNMGGATPDGSGPGAPPAPAKPAAPAAPPAEEDDGEEEAAAPAPAPTPADPIVDRAHALALAAAERVVAREMQDIAGGNGKKGLAVRYAAKGWPEAIAQFFEAHASFVGAVLSVPEAAARVYCERQREAVTHGGLNVLIETQAARVAALQRLALTTN